MKKRDILLFFEQMNFEQMIPTLIKQAFERTTNRSEKIGKFGHLKKALEIIKRCSEKAMVGLFSERDITQKYRFVLKMHG